MQAHTHTPAVVPVPPVHTLPHTLTHTVVTPTHTHPSSYTCTTCAHLYTYLQISTNINSPQLSQSLFTNIHTVILQYLSKTNSDREVNELHAPHDHSTPSKEAYGPWVLVSRKRHASKKGKNDFVQPS